MSGATDPEAVAGIVLIFFAPGYFLTKATFPEWRVRGERGLLRALEIGTLSFVLSVVLTVVVGYGLLSVGPAGFQATWTDPQLEAVLFAIAVGAFAAGWYRGAFAKEPPNAPVAEDGPGEIGSWDLARALGALDRKEDRLERSARHASSEAERRVLRGEIDQVRDERRRLQEEREREYAG